MGSWGKFKLTSCMEYKQSTARQRIHEKKKKKKKKTEKKNVKAYIYVPGVHPAYRVAGRTRRDGTRTLDFDRSQRKKAAK